MQNLAIGVIFKKDLKSQVSSLKNWWEVINIFIFGDGLWKVKKIGDMCSGSNLKWVGITYFPYFFIRTRTIRVSANIAKMDVIGHFHLLSYHHALSYSPSQWSCGWSPLPEISRKILFWWIFLQLLEVHHRCHLSILYYLHCDNSLNPKKLSKFPSTMRTLGKISRKR